MYQDAVTVAQLKVALNAMHFSSASEKLLKELDELIEKAIEEYVANMNMKAH